jgi:hypothetical protein
MIFASSSLAGSADLVDVFLRLRGNGQIPTVPVEQKGCCAPHEAVRQVRMIMVPH